MDAQPRILPVGLCGRIEARSYFSALLLCLRNQALIFFSPWSLCHATAGLGTKDFYFTCPKQRKPSQSSAVPQQLRKPLSSDIYSTSDISWESLKLFWKETILPQVLIFRLYKAHVRFFAFILSIHQAGCLKGSGSFVFKRSAPSSSLPRHEPKALGCFGAMPLPSFWPQPKPQVIWPSYQSSWNDNKWAKKCTSQQWTLSWNDNELVCLRTPDLPWT